MRLNRTDGRGTFSTLIIREKGSAYGGGVELPKKERGVLSITPVKGEHWMTNLGEENGEELSPGDYTGKAIEIKGWERGSHD